MIVIDILPDPITSRQIKEHEINITHTLLLKAQLDMYYYFEWQLAKAPGNTLTLEQYLEDVKPYVMAMRQDIDSRLAADKPELIRLGLLKEDIPDGKDNP
jgi:hypothetical protein